MAMKTKTFDCVEMKNRIQVELAKKYQDMSDTERFEAIERELMSADNPISQWWRKVGETKSKALKASSHK